MLLLFHSFLTDALLAILQYLSWLLPAIASDNVWLKQAVAPFGFFLKKWNNTFNVRFCAQRLKQQTWVNKERLLPIIAELGF